MLLSTVEDEQKSCKEFGTPVTLELEIIQREEVVR
jgi:hypothetical protein